MEEISGKKNRAVFGPNLGVLERVGRPQVENHAAKGGDGGPDECAAVLNPLAGS